MPAILTGEEILNKFNLDEKYKILKFKSIDIVSIDYVEDFDFLDFLSDCGENVQFIIHLLNRNNINYLKCGTTVYEISLYNSRCLCKIQYTEADFIKRIRILKLKKLNEYDIR